MPAPRIRVEGGSIIYAGEHSITRERPERYKIYLPKAMNLLWRDLKGKKAKVYLVIDAEEVENRN
jgi:hypothetical protein